jgi:hypothetical protein
MELNIPAQLNGVQLQKELKTAGIKLNDYPRLVDGKLVLDIAKQDETKAKAIVDAHIGIDNSADIAAAKSAVLDKLGIDEIELGLLLA